MNDINALNLRAYYMPLYCCLDESINKSPNISLLRELCTSFYKFIFEFEYFYSQFFCVTSMPSGQVALA